MPSGASKGLRFYAVIDADTVDQELLQTQKVSAVTYRRLAAVVAPAPYVRVTPGDAELQDFIRVVDALSTKGPVIPAPPGTVFRNEQVLTRWMDVHYATLHDALGAVERDSDGRSPYDYVRMELGA